MSCTGGHDDIVGEGEGFARPHGRHEGDAPAEAELQHHLLVFALVRPVADHQGRERSADEALGLGEGVDEDIRPLQVAQHADIEEIDGVLAGVDRIEIAVVDAVVDAFGAYAWLADATGIGLLLIVADEGERVAERLEKSLGRQDRQSRGRAVGVVQAAAMRRIEAGYAIPVDPQG